MIAPRPTPAIIWQRLRQRRLPRELLWLTLLFNACGAAAAWPSPLAEAAPAAELDRVMALLSQRQHAQADFVEKKYLSVLIHPLQSSGLLIYDAPDHLEERTVLPRAQSVVLDHGNLSLQVGARQRTMQLADYPQLAPLIDCIRATLAGDRTALEREFHVEFSGDLQQWLLRLEPRDPQLSATLRQIEIRGERDAVHTLQVLQSDGDRSVMSITPRQ